MAEYPALVSWRGESGQTLLADTTSYAIDCSDPERERTYTRPVAAEMLIDAGATVERSTWEHVIAHGRSQECCTCSRERTRCRGPFPFSPRLATMRRFARGSTNRGSATTQKDLDERIVIGRALMNACRFKHAGIALRLLERAIALDPDLGRRIDRWQGRQAFVEFLIQHPGSSAAA